MKGAWKDGEIKKLFLFVEDGKKKGNSLGNIFKKYAGECKRQPDSIRNFYYSEISEFKKNPELANSLEIDLTWHEIKSQNCFGKEEEKKLLSEIADLQTKGFSVRKACLFLAKNNLEDMIRFQNKYRNLIKKEKGVIKSKKDKTMASKKSVNLDVGNVLFMPSQKQRLEDKDIEALFLGLVKIVKKNALQSVNEKIGQELFVANENLRKAFVQISSKENKIKQLLMFNNELLNANEKLNNKLKLQRSQTIVGADLKERKEGGKKSGKVSDLKKFVGRLFEAKNNGVQNS
ncbi:MAG: hypothetical protein RR400_01805 [Clostridia bacterium]